MWEKEYTGLNKESWKCPKCCGILRLNFTRFECSPQFRESKRYTYMKSMRCQNRHYFLLYGFGNNEMEKLVELCVDDDLNMEDLHSSVVAWDNKYSKEYNSKRFNELTRFFSKGIRKYYESPSTSS